MRNGFVSACAFLFAFSSWPYCLGAKPEQPKPPKLIVQITMDQLRGDLLRDYVPALNQGFARLENGASGSSEGMSIMR